MQNDYFSVPKDIYEDILLSPETYLHYYTYDGRQCARHIDKTEKSHSLKIDKKLFEDIRRTLFSDSNRKPLQGNFGGAATSEFVQPHLNHTYLLKFDIVKYFNSISYELFEKCTANKLQNMDMLKSMYFKPRLVVGLSGSAIIAEVVLIKVADSFINALLHSPEFADKEISYTRFYDDIYLSSDDRKTLSNIQAKVTKQLAANGFTVNAKKSSLSKVENSTILKNRINNGRISVGKRFKNNLRLQMYVYKPDATDLSSIMRTISELRALVGKISFILRTETNPAHKWNELHEQYLHELDEFEAMRNQTILENM